MASLSPAHQSLLLTGLTSLATVLCAPGKAFSQSVDLRGTAIVRMAVELDSAALQLGELLVEPEASGMIGEIAWTVIGRLRLDTADTLEPGEQEGQSAFRGAMNRRLFLGDDTDLELREAYADIVKGNWFIRAGKQQVVWGQADGLRVLDRINPLSFREFILGDFEDRRIPTWMVNAERPVGDVTLQLLWMFDHTYDEVPRLGTFAVTSPLFAPQVPDAFNGEVFLGEANRPDRFIRDDDFGARLTGFTSGWDWSLNALYAYGDGQVFRQTKEVGRIDVTPTYERSWLFGGSASNTFGKATLRAELGWQSDVFSLLENRLDLGGVVETDEISGVVGLDYQMNADTFLSAQLFIGHIGEAPAGLVRDRTEATLSGLYRRQFRNDTVEVEALILHGLNRGDGLVQIDASYELSDTTSIGLGVDLFYGTLDTTFGQFSSSDRISAVLSYNF